MLFEYLFPISRYEVLDFFFFLFLRRLVHLTMITFILIKVISVWGLGVV